MVKEPIVRQLLLYSSTSIESPSSFLSLSLINNSRLINSFDTLIYDTRIPNYDFFPSNKAKSGTNSLNLPMSHQCPTPFENKNRTYSMYIPCYKRNYFDKMLPDLSCESMQP